jgi:glycosyltransferase involved in cell wall biosynthesis
MVGRHPGYITTQGLILSDRFSSAKYSVLATSDVRNRYLRLFDIVRTLIWRGRQFEIQCLEVYSGASFVVADVASWLGVLLGQRIVMVLHGGGLPEFMRRHPSWARRVLKRSHQIVTPSNFLARAAEAHGFKVRVIPNVIDFDDYPFRIRREVKARLFWMRSFDHAWNPQMAVRVLAALKQHVPGATLVMAGKDKGLEAETRLLAEQLGVRESVRFAGFLDHAGKSHEGLEADIFINTNHIDNMPVAIVEAWAMGLPVVATAVGGVPDLIEDGRTGILVGDDDINGMVQAVRRLLSDPELAERLSQNGRRRAEESSWTRVRQEWEQVFTGVLANRFVTQ